MAIAVQRMWCHCCGRNTRHERNYFEFGWGCLLSLLSGCFFLPVWLFIGMVDAFRAWHCSDCGAEYSWKAFKLLTSPQAVAQLRIIPTPAKAVKPPPPPVEREPIDWTAWKFRAFDTIIVCKRSLADVYRSLPEWAQPIVWGLGIAAPIVMLMVAARFVLTFQ